VVWRRAKRAQKQQKVGSPIPKKASFTPPKSGELSPNGGDLPNKGKNKGRSKPPKKSAAVTITLLPPEDGEEQVSMAEVMKRATNRVNLAVLNMDYLRPKRSQTGGLILEIPGENSTPRADALASKLSEALGDTKVRIARPTMWAELRVHNLVDSVSVDQVAETIAKAGGCQAGQIRMGDIKQAPSGLFGVWMRAPQTAAHKVAALGKVVIGWTVAKVELLQPRPLQCHRCLKFGHVRQRCPEEIDRSDKCYRCGQPGHLAAGCTATPNCPVCADLGKPAEHRLGGASCIPPPNKKKKKGRHKKRKKRAHTEETLSSDPY
jgi:hypothetical protein